MAKSATPLGNAGIDIASAIHEQLLHASRPRRFTSANHVLVVGRVQYVGTLEIIDRQIFRTAFECPETPGSQESRNRHAFWDMLVLVPAVEFALVGGIDVGHKQKQSRLRHRGTSQVWETDSMAREKRAS